MEGENEGSTARTLRAELRALRRGEGRTLLKLLDCTELRRALGNPPERELVNRFDTAVSALGGDVRTLALKNAYGIAYNGSDLLVQRRISFGAQAKRSPDTLVDWENERIDDLVARLMVGAVNNVVEDWQVVIAVSAGRILTVAEGALGGEGFMRTYANPQTEPFLPGYIYRLPPHARPDRLTLAVVFIDEAPAAAWCCAGADLFGICIGDGQQRMELQAGGPPGIDAACHGAVHYGQPSATDYHAIAWCPT